MAEDLEKKEEKKETKEKETKAKTSKTNTAKTTTTRKTRTKKDTSSEGVKIVEKNDTKTKTKKSDSKEDKSDSRLADLTELMERIEEETEKQVSKTRRKKVQREEKPEKIEELEEKNEENTIKPKSTTRKSSKQKTENKTNTKDLTVKENAKEIMINTKHLEEIEEEIKKQTTISEEKKNKMNRIIFHNIAIANIIMLYFIFLILGYKTISSETFMIDLQVFSIITIGITIIIFEKAYKKDSTEYAMHGIETLALSVATLLSTYAYARYQEKFIYIMLTTCYIFAIYFVAKSIIIYLKMKSKALKRTKDIRKIAKS